MKKKLTIIIVLLSSLTSFGQDEIYNISFHYTHSLRIPNHYIDIEVSRRGNELKLHVNTKAVIESKEWSRENIDTTFIITKEQFTSLTAAVRKISCTNIAKEIGTFSTGEDGNTCEITYGSFQNSITYKIWSPDYETSDRGLADFYNCCLLIAKTARLKPTILFN